MSDAAGDKHHEGADRDWLGRLPPDWRAERLKYVATLSNEKVEPGGSFRYVGMENVSSGDGKHIRTEAVVPEGLSVSFRRGDVLFGKLRPYLAKSWLATFAGVCSSEFLVLRAQKLSPEFLRYVTLSRDFVSIVDSSTYGAKMPRASWDFVGMLEVPVPTHPLSAQIARFLDYETAKIDRLIEKQQQLIALLKEKRQAVITKAATKGVTAGAPLRDSGIGWMGQVPSHWRILPVKRLFDVSYGLMGEIDRSLDEGTRIISLPNVLKDGTLDLKETSFRTLSKAEKLAAGLRKGDLLFNWRNGSIDHVGKTALFDGDGDFAHVSFLLKLRALSRDVDPHFYWLALNGLRSSGFFGSSKLQVNITYNQTELRKVRLPVPPIEEQQRIVKVVLQQYQAIDATTERATRQITLLQERRTALISAAVTGKIDVRTWTPPEAA